VASFAEYTHTYVHSSISGSCIRIENLWRMEHVPLGVEGLEDYGEDCGEEGSIEKGVAL
jgi:hypothetical protein